MWDQDEIKNQVVDWISEGKTLREFCRQEGKPSFVTIYNWKDADVDFALRFARARESGEDVIHQECLAIADTTQIGQIVTEKADGTTETKLADMIEHRKLRIDTRLKLLAKWNPKKYGDKNQMEVTGANGGPIQSSVTVEFVKTGE